jgi:hypothetical protein
MYLSTIPDVHRSVFSTVCSGSNVEAIIIMKKLSMPWVRGGFLVVCCAKVLYCPNTAKALPKTTGV